MSNTLREHAHAYTQTDTKTMNNIKLTYKLFIYCLMEFLIQHYRKNENTNRKYFM